MCVCACMFPKMLTFLGIIFNMKYISNMILFDFVLKIKFDWDFILKIMQEKVSILKKCV